MQNAASRHAVWLSAAAIITDQIGRVLLVHPTYREDDRWLLPGGAADPDEHPLDACRREIAEELALPEPALPRVLAVHSLSPHHPDIRPGIPCPGEIRYIFDGGTLTPDQIQAIRLPSTEAVRVRLLRDPGRSASTAPRGRQDLLMRLRSAEAG
ncbi:NUDIX domain-containing protein [Streptomyces bobili]